MNKKGFTLIEMLTTTAIMVVIFGLLALIFGRATTIHKIVRSGGDAENFGIYLMNTIVYGPGISREKGLIGTQPFTYTELPLSSTVLQFKDANNNVVAYTLSTSTNTLSYGTVDLKPTWAKDRGMEVLPESGFYYYNDTVGTVPATGTDPVRVVGIKLMLKSTLQNIAEAVTLYRCVRIRNQIDF